MPFRDVAFNIKQRRLRAIRMTAAAQKPDSSDFRNVFLLLCVRVKVCFIQNVISFPISSALAQRGEKETSSGERTIVGQLDESFQVLASSFVRKKSDLTPHKSFARPVRDRFVRDDYQASDNRRSMMDRSRRQK
jgi:hypothetical protein